MSRFIRFPSDRWLERLTCGEADALDLGIMATIVALAQQQGGIDHRQLVVRLQDLHRTLNHQCSERTTSNRLKKLRDLGEIAFETHQGQRGAWRIEIVADDYFRQANLERPDKPHFEKPTELEASSGGDFEVTSKDGSSERPSSSSTERIQTTSELRSMSDASPPDQNQRLEEKDPDQEQGSVPDDTSKDGALVDIPLGHAAESLNPTPTETPRSVDTFLQLLPENLRGSSARTGIARRIEPLPSHTLAQILDAFDNALSGGDVRKPLAYLYHLFNKELKRAA